jgi:hypothetical protein
LDEGIEIVDDALIEAIELRPLVWEGGIHGQIVRKGPKFRPT